MARTPDVGAGSACIVVAIAADEHAGPVTVRIVATVAGVEALDASVVLAGQGAVFVGLTVAARRLIVDDKAGVAAGTGIEKARVLVDLPVSQPTEGARRHQQRDEKNNRHKGSVGEAHWGVVPGNR